MIKPRIRTMAPRLAGAPLSSRGATRGERERERLREREQTADWRKWYHSARWQKLRQEVFLRDLFTCQATGQLLTGRHPAGNSPVCDHIVPHDGDPALFWDPQNLRCVAKSWHDTVKQAIEKGSQGAVSHPRWLSPSLIPLVIVCGPPASGKSSFVRQHAVPSDLVIDLDEIVAHLSGQPLGHTWDRERWLNPALYYRNDLLGSLSRPSDYSTAWFVVGEPKASARHFWATALQPRRVVVLEVDAATCLQRAAQDADRDLAHTADAVAAWWRDYSPRPGEERVAPGARPT